MISHNTYDRPLYRINYQWQASIHFHWQMVGQYDVIFIGTIIHVKFEERQIQSQFTYLLTLDEIDYYAIIVL